MYFLIQQQIAYEITGIYLAQPIFAIDNNGRITVKSRDILQRDKASTYHTVI